MVTTIFELFGVEEDAGDAELIQAMSNFTCERCPSAIYSTVIIDVAAEIRNRGIRKGLEIAAVVLDNVGTDDVYPSQRMADVMDVCTNIAREIRAKAEEVGK